MDSSRIIKDSCPNFSKKSFFFEVTAIKKNHHFALLLLIILHLSSCSEKSRYGNKKIFRYNIAEGVSSLDPAFARSLDNISAVNHIFNGLVQLDDKLNVKACIAKSWEIDSSGLVYTFHLRDDVYFHKSSLFGKDSTRKVKASDFEYSFKRLVDKKVLSPGKWVMNPMAKDGHGELAIEVINDTTLRLFLEKPFPPFLGILSMQYCSVVPKEAVEQLNEDFRQSPIGTGPFSFKYWKENGKLILLKNSNYFEKDSQGIRLPYLDAISISFNRDQEITFLKFLKSEIDYLSGLKGTYKDELLSLNGNLREKYKSKLSLIKGPYLNTEYLGILVDTINKEADYPLLNKNLRKAINYGFDRGKMLKYLRNNIGFPATEGFVPKGLEPNTKSLNYGYFFSRDSVKRYLEKAGYGNNNKIPKIKIGTTSEYLDICEFIQFELSEFGFEIEIEVNQAATNNELIANAKMPLFRKSWVADYPDAENYLSLFLSKNFSPSGPNYTHYKNATFDSLYFKAMQLANPEERTKVYRVMDSLIMEEAPIIPLFYDQTVRFIPNYISGIKVNPMNLLVLKYTKKDMVN